MLSFLLHPSIEDDQSDSHHSFQNRRLLQRITTRLSCTSKERSICHHPHLPAVPPHRKGYMRLLPYKCSRYRIPRRHTQKGQEQAETRYPRTTTRVWFGLAWHGIRKHRGRLLRKPHSAHAPSGQETGRTVSYKRVFQWHGEARQHFRAGIWHSARWRKVIQDIYNPLKNSDAGHVRSSRMSTI
jgi:hypothetical protein